MFVDSSVLVAILSGEEDAGAWAERIERAGSGVTSPLVVLESTMRLSSKLSVEPVDVGAVVASFLADAAIAVVPIEPADTGLAIDAFQRTARAGGTRPALTSPIASPTPAPSDLALGCFTKATTFPEQTWPDDRGRRRRCQRTPSSSPLAFASATRRMASARTSASWAPITA